MILIKTAILLVFTIARLAALPTQIQNSTLLNNAVNSEQPFSNQISSESENVVTNFENQLNQNTESDIDSTIIDQLEALLGPNNLGDTFDNNANQIDILKSDDDKINSTPFEELAQLASCYGYGYGYPYYGYYGYPYYYGR
ncbi:uncharacterized protein LOC129618506 [Condylostylus longicornis]|uniref:uncharacterized protein LOC129618506 n=1 Tax=Condylostylus longicornis TaxID=2530218 RepID=UPI00244E1E83|nr:uncharacterized protein LOC129618506 [Condylostylus longicornis]